MRHRTCLHGALIHQLDLDKEMDPMSTMADLQHTGWCNPALCDEDEYGDVDHKADQIVVRFEGSRWWFHVHQYHELKRGDEGVESLNIDVTIESLAWDMGPIEFWLLREDIPALVETLTNIYDKTA